MKPVKEPVPDDAQQQTRHGGLVYFRPQAPAERIEARAKTSGQ